MVTANAATGRFITFEGGEGAGKSTQVRLLATALREEGYDVLETREPGGSCGAEAVRHVLLSGAAETFGIRMEAVLFAAARSDHVQQTIRPAVQAGRIVLCDRFMDSSRVYQGVTGNLEPEFVRTLERVAINGMVPDMTILLDVPAELGLERARERGGAAPDRFEKEDIRTHESRRTAFLELAETESRRFRVIDGHRVAETVAKDVRAAVQTVLPDRRESAAGAKRKRSR